jgi:hypothetical protein
MRGRPIWTTVVAGAAVAGLMLASGCAATPAGLDGDLVDDWAAIADATVPVPPVGACYSSQFEANARGLQLIGLTKVSCDEFHILETYHVGQFPPEVAARQTVPPVGGPEQRAAFADCEAKAKEYVGDHWYLGRLFVIFAPVNAAQWDGGGRHYRCDLTEVNTFYGMAMARRAGPLKDALRGARPLASTCYDFVGETKGQYDDLSPVDCATPHDAEFAGVFEPPGYAPPTDAQQQQDIGYRGCDKVVAAYLGGTPDGMRVGAAYWGFDPRDWERGDKRLRCFAAKPADKKMKGSVKGLGNRYPQTV